MSANELTPAKVESAAARAARRASPFGLLQQEIERVFDDFGRWPGAFGPAGFRPSMEVTETDKTIEIAMELPGIEEKDVEISIADDILTVRGEKKAEREEKAKSYRLVERHYGAFERSVALPHGVDSDAVKASMSKGVLKLVLPKPAASQSQKIKINQS